MLGRLEPYDATSMQWSAYAARVGEFFLANEVSEDRKKVAIFLSVIGANTYELLQDLCCPNEPNTQNYEELVRILKEHYQPTPTVIAERYVFHLRNQQSDESISEYVASLKKLAKSCAFGQFFSEAIRDRLVCGMKCETTRKRLLVETDLHLENAVKISQMLETAEREARKIEVPQQNINLVQKRNNVNGGKINRKTSFQSQQKPCFRCKKFNHSSENCRFKEASCYKCGKKGHISPACNVSSNFQRPSSSYVVNHSIECEGTEVESEETLTVYSLKNKVAVDEHPEPKAFVEVKINSQPISMEIDSGASVSIISKDKIKVPFKSTNKKLSAASGHLLKLAGEAVVQVNLEGMQKKLKLFIVDGECPSLLGRSWIRAFWGPKWVNRLTNGLIGNVNAHTIVDDCSNRLKKLLENYSDSVFKPGLGLIKGITAHLSLQKNVAPKFCKSRPVPFSIKCKVEEELENMERNGNIEKVMTSEWASPIVPVQKANGTIRICGDYKATLNPKLQVDRYPLPRPEECFQSMRGGKKFSKIDLKQAFNQIMLDEESKSLTTMSTTKGLYRWLRLPFGIASSPAIFANVMDRVLHGLKGLAWYQDDIIVTGRTDEEHFDNLTAVLERLKEYGLRAGKDKCEYFKSSVKYLGMIVNEHGIEMLPDKVNAILKVQTPRNVKELSSFIGMINYYGKFINNFSTLASPLHKLRRDGERWNWSEKEQSSFEALKQALVSSNVLIHYDPKLPVKLDCDASAVGIGSVLSHILPNGTERPICYASRTLSKSEHNYPQVEKEALSIVWSVKKFHQYLFGRKFSLVTDHQSLTSIFNPSKEIPQTSTSRLARWALFLMQYEYDIVYRSTRKHLNADCLSRLPMAASKSVTLDPECSVLNIQSIESLYIDAVTIAKSSRADPVLSKVIYCIKYGWERNQAIELQPYFIRRNELTIEEGCLLWGMRVVIPTRLRSIILKVLHDGHPGIVRMKAIGRSHVWWPKLDSDIERTVKACNTCQRVQNLPPKAPLHPLEIPNGPWERINIDFAGPFMNKMWLICVDAYSKFPEVISMNVTTAKRTIKELSLLFSRYGYPKQLISDNGPQFISSEFASFLRSRGIKHIRTAPYHPSSNGEAERFVQTFKKGMKSSVIDYSDPEERLCNFLRVYRSTPHTTTGVAPVELFFKRMIRGPLDLLRPDFKNYVNQKQYNQKLNHDKHAKTRSFNIGDHVMVRDFRQANPSWVEGQIERKLGPLSYLVKIDEGICWKRHVDHLLYKDHSKENTAVGAEKKEWSFITVGNKINGENTPAFYTPGAITPEPEPQVVHQPPTPRVIRVSSRQGKPPDRLTYSQLGQPTWTHHS